MRVLLIEDDQRTANALGRGLREEGYVVDVARSGEDGEDLASANDYGVIVLDWYLPGKDGLAVCRALRASGATTPILMLTARDALADRVAGLDTGVDDYLTKPFAFEEILARLRALLRRSEMARPPVLSVLDLRLDPASHQVTRGGAPIELTTKEYQILEALMRKSGQVVTRTGLEEQVWGGEADLTTNAVDVHISHLRRKIDHGHAVPILHTVRGRGYVLGPPRAL
jgi:DNA-binding response OmpR family regulator